jgi:hypothetical protein
MEGSMDEEPLNPKIIPCKYCGQAIPETTTFCWYCGRELIARPERPEYQTSNKVSGKVLLISFLIMAAAVALFWSVYTR